MNRDEGDLPAGEGEFDTLMLALGSGEITDAERARLSEIIEADPVAREAYLDYMLADAALQWHFGAVESGGDVLSPSGQRPAPPTRGNARRWIVPLAAAACMALAFAVYEILSPPREGGAPADGDGGGAGHVSPPPVSPSGRSYADPVAIPGWSLLVGVDTDYHILADHTVQLDSGELHAAATDPASPAHPELLVRTADGDIRASGTRIYITASNDGAPDQTQPDTSGSPNPTQTAMKTPAAINTLTRVFIIAGMAAISNGAGSAQGGAGDQLEARDGKSPQKLQKDGNYKEAYAIYHKLLLDPAHGGQAAAADVASAHDCLRRLNRIVEWDAFAAEVVAAHGEDWRVLHSVAKQFQHTQHYGSVVGGEFERGNYSGRYIDTSQRDRLHALQLFQQALGQMADEKDGAALAGFYADFASAVKANGDWRLQLLSDLGQLPDYGVPIYYSNVSGAPVKADGSPVYYEVPESWEAAANDGERWRWLVAQMVKVDPARAAAAKLEYANFLQRQFGVQTMGHAPRLGEDGKPEEGVYAVHTLEDGETIARLATGIRRWELPKRHDFVSLYREIGSDKPVRKPTPIRDLSYKVYHGDWDKLPDFSELQPAHEGELESGLFDISVAGRGDHFGVVFEGTLRVEEAGEYTFWVNSDDGAALFVGDGFKVDNDGLHGIDTGNKGVVKLDEGEHPIRVTVFEKTGAEGIVVSWQGPATGGGRQFLSVGGRVTVPAEQALDALAGVYENRLQYPQAAAVWREVIEHFGPGHNGHRRDRLSQIVDNWGRFENTQAFTKGGDTTLGYVFRNGEKLELRATAIKVETLLEEIKTYLKSNPKEPKHHKIDPGSLGHRLVMENEEKFLGEVAAEWEVELEPRERHWDRRIDVAVPVDKAGAYLVEGTLADGNTSRLIVWINDTAIVSKPLDRRQLYFVADSTTGKPVAGANLEFFGYRTRWLSEREGGRDRHETDTLNFAEASDAQGLCYPDPEDLKKDYNWLVTVRDGEAGQGGRLAILGFAGVWSADYNFANFQASKAYAVTDRPLYRPGATVNLKAWVRAARYDMAWVSHFAGKRFKVLVHNPKGEAIYEKDLTAGEFGGISGALELPEDATLGNYQLAVFARPFVDPFTNKRHKERHLGGTSFRVEEYKKPEFQVAVVPPSEPTELGEKITAKVSAKYYFGAPVRNAKVHYKVERTAHTARWTPPRPWDWFYGKGYWWHHQEYHWYPGWDDWGCWIWPAGGWNPAEIVAENTVEIGPDGTVEIDIETDVAKELFGNTDHRYSITAEVIDESRRTIVGSGSVIAARQPFEIYSWLSGGHFRVGDNFDAHFKARTADGKPVGGSGTVTLYKVSYDEEGVPSEKKVADWKAAPDEAGSASQRIAASEAGHYRVAYKLTDTKGNTREGATMAVVRGGGDDGSGFRFNDLEVVLDKAEYKPGERVKVLINTDQEDSTVAFFVRPAGGIYKKPEILSLGGRSIEREVEVGIADMPNFYVEAITVVDGRLHTQVKQVVVPPEKRVLTVEVTPSSERYKPGEKGKVNVRLLDASGEPFVGETVLSIYDKSLEYISGGHPAGDIRAHFWKWRRNHEANHQVSLGGSYDQLLKRGEKGMGHVGVFGRGLADYGSRALPGGPGPGGGAGAQWGAFQLRSAEGIGGRFSRGGALDFAGNSAFDEAGESEGGVLLDEFLEDSRGADTGSFNAGVDPGDSGGGSPTPISIRKDFADSAFWSAGVVTDAAGNAEIAVEMPENLTTWKVLAWGLGDGTVVGSGEAEVITSKDLLIRMQAPRFFVEKDEVVLSANVHNYLEDAQDVKVTLETEGGHLALAEGGAQHQDVRIAPGEDSRVDWRVRVSGEGEAVVRMLAVAAGDSDAMEMRFPVFIHGALKTESWSGVVAADREGAELKFSVPEERRPEQTHLEIRYSPSIAMSMVDALPYLATYPYKNCESTVNRFLPAVVTQKILKDMGVDLAAVKQKRNNLNPQEIGDPAKRAAQWKRHGENNPVWDEAELARMVKAGLRDLSSIQNGDGGFPWFRGGHSGAHTTAGTVHGLLLAKANGVALVPGMLERGVAWLEGYQKGEVDKIKNAERKRRPWKPRADNLDAYVAMVLAEAGKSNEEMNTFLYRDRTELAVYAKALAGIAFHLLGKERERDMLVRNIRQFQVEDPENQSTYLELGNAGYWYYWYGNEVEAHAAYLKLLSLVAPEDPATAGLAKYLLNNRKHGSYWHSTRDTAFSIEALAAYAKASGEAEPDMTIEVIVDGEKRKEVTVDGSNLFTFDNVIELSGDAVSGGAHKVEFRKRGDGPLYFNTYLTVFSLEDFIRKAGLEIKVERNFYLVDRGSTTIKAAGARNQVVDFKTGFDKRKRLASGDRLAIGDIVEVELVLESKNDYEYIMFEDRKAAGFEPVQLRSGHARPGGLGAYMELRDERVAFFVRRLARGKHSLSYRLRAEVPGTFSALPANGNGVYAPELRANSDELKISITDPGE